MIKTKFVHKIFGQEVKVLATAKDVDAYGAIGLRLKFFDKNGEQIEIGFDRDTFEELEETAGEMLYEIKYSKELEF